MSELIDRAKQTEREKYENMWAQDAYRDRSPGLRIAPEVYKFFRMHPAERIIDWGCGTGRAAKWFQAQGLRAFGIDHAANALEEDVWFLRACLWDIRPGIVPYAPWAFCCDVLEHLPEEHVEQAVRNIAAYTTRGAFFKVADADDDCGRLIGQELHLTRRPQQWWFALFKKYFRVIAATNGDRPGTFNFYCEPRGAGGR